MRPCETWRTQSRCFNSGPLQQAYEDCVPWPQPVVAQTVAFPLAPYSAPEPLSAWVGYWAAIWATPTRAAATTTKMQHHFSHNQYRWRTRQKWWGIIQTINDYVTVVIFEQQKSLCVRARVCVCVADGGDFLPAKQSIGQPCAASTTRNRRPIFGIIHRVDKRHSQTLVMLL